jgi:hypothetical protein
MKTRVIVTFAMIIGAVALCLAMAKPPTKGRPIKIDVNGNCIQIPGTEISQSDQKNVKETFEKYDQGFLKEFGRRIAIYKVQPYEKGVPQRPLGKMKIDKKIAVETDNYSKSVGLTSWTTQIGLCKQVGVKCSSGGPNCLDKSHELVKEIAPILDRYSRE